MIANSAFWIILALLFWVAFALLVVTIAGECFLKFMYYRWDKQDREEERIHDLVKDTMENDSESNND